VDHVIHVIFHQIHAMEHLTATTESCCSVMMTQKKQPLFVATTAPSKANYGAPMLKECATLLLLFREAVANYCKLAAAVFPNEVTEWIFRLLAWRYTFLDTRGSFINTPCCWSDVPIPNRYHIRVPFMWSRDKTSFTVSPAACLEEALIEQLFGNLASMGQTTGVGIQSIMKQDHIANDYYRGDGEVITNYHLYLNRVGSVKKKKTGWEDSVRAAVDLRGNPEAMIVFVLQ
jgi:hypothetical protein